MNLFKVEAEYFGGEVKVLSPTQTFSDHRGSFSITYRADEFKEIGLPEFVQDNCSTSMAGVVRGLHFQLDPPIGKLMRVTRGIALLVAVDVRPESPTFLQWVTTVVSGENKRQVWASARFARGFSALTDIEVQYKCTNHFNAASDSAIRWDDPRIGVEWGVSNPILSERDKHAPTVSEYFGGLSDDIIRIPEHQ